MPKTPNKEKKGKRIKLNPIAGRKEQVDDSMRVCWDLVYRTGCIRGVRL